MRDLALYSPVYSLVKLKRYTDLLLCLVRLQLRELVVQCKPNRLLYFEEVESRPLQVRLKEHIDPFNTGSSYIPKMSLLVDLYSNKLLLI